MIKSQYALVYAIWSTYFVMVLAITHPYCITLITMHKQKKQAQWKAQ